MAEKFAAPASISAPEAFVTVSEASKFTVISVPAVMPVVEMQPSARSMVFSKATWSNETKMKNELTELAVADLVARESAVSKWTIVTGGAVSEDRYEYLMKRQSDGVEDVLRLHIPKDEADLQARIQGGVTLWADRMKNKHATDPGPASENEKSEKIS